jgi:hypothetical protein
MIPNPHAVFSTEATAVQNIVSSSDVMKGWFANRGFQFKELYWLYFVVGVCPPFLHIFSPLILFLPFFHCHYFSFLVLAILT